MPIKSCNFSDFRRNAPGPVNVGEILDCVDGETAQRMQFMNRWACVRVERAVDKEVVASAVAKNIARVAKTPGHIVEHQIFRALTPTKLCFQFLETSLTENAFLRIQTLDNGVVQRGGRKCELAAAIAIMIHSSRGRYIPRRGAVEHVLAQRAQLHTRRALASKDEL